MDGWMDGWKRSHAVRKNLEWLEFHVDAILQHAANAQVSPKEGWHGRATAPFEGHLLVVQTVWLHLGSDRSR
jgi:hypothetical protein